MSSKLRRTRKTPATAGDASEDRYVDSGRSKVIVIPRTLLHPSSDDRRVVTVAKLRHPRTGVGEMFLFDGSNENVLQLTQFKEGHGSWFIADTVQKDGSMVFATPIDPLFLFLPYLMESTKFRPLDQIVQDCDFPESHRLSSCTRLEQIENIAELRENDTLKAYRYDRSKCMSWLAVKIRSLIAVLRSKGIDVSMGARAATYAVSSRQGSTDEEAYVRYAHGLLSDYLPEDISQDLLEHLGFAKVSLVTEEPPAKRRKMESVTKPLEDYSNDNEKPKQPNKQVPKLTASQRALKKADKTGMKSISSFFGKRC